MSYAYGDQCVQKQAVDDAAKTDMSATERDINTLSNLLFDLSESYAVLRKRLHPVLDPGVPAVNEDPKPVQPPMPPMSPLREQLIDLQARISNLNTSLRNLTDRLEI